MTNYPTDQGLPGGAIPVWTNSSAGYDGDLDSYAGIGAMGPYGGMTATTSSPVILASLLYTGSRIMKLRQFSLQPVVTTAYTTAGFKAVAVRKLEAYTAGDTGGTDVSAYFGTRKNSKSPAVTGITARVAGTPGTATATGLTAGTRTLCNSIFQRTFYASTAAAQDPISVSLDEPLVLRPNEGLEFILILSSVDATGTMSFTSQFDWTVEDS